MNRLDSSIRSTEKRLRELQDKLDRMHERNARDTGHPWYADDDIRHVEKDIVFFKDRLQSLMQRRDTVTPSFSSIPEIEKYLQAWKIWALAHYHAGGAVPAKYRHDSLDQLHDILSREMERKRKDIYRRCYEAVGDIIHSANLRVHAHPYLSISGFIVGVKGTAFVHTVTMCRDGDMTVFHGMRIRRMG